MINKSSFLGTGKLSSLLMKQSVPAMIGLLTIALYNLVDTIFIGRSVGTLGIGGVAVSFPIQMLMMAVSMALGMGMASIISRALGANDHATAKSAFGTFFTSVFFISVIMTVLGIIFLKPLLILFGATPDLLPYAMDYMGIIFFGSIFLAFASSSNNIIRAQGHAKTAMTVMIISIILNFILDPIFIFVLHMGVKGAALATVIGQIFGAVYAFIYFVSPKSTIQFSLKNLCFNFKIFKESIAIGSSSFARQAAGSFAAIIINNSLAFYGGSLAIAAFGVVNRLLAFVFMPIFGIVQGMQPILGFNYGAKKFQRAKESITLSIKYATILSIVAFVLFMIFTRPIISLFSTDVALIDMATRAMRIIVLLFPIIGFQLVAGGLYQSLGKAIPAFVLSILRQIIFFIPLVLILPLWFGLDGIWYSFVVADFFAFIVTIFMVRSQLKLLSKSSSASVS